ncbi:MAG: hypothetical protein MRJ65_08940 [Candidatus Brocadiaceae bacterium]|nr:hypothetical protein [Candidatus Brocadiaceae bacterium]
MTKGDDSKVFFELFKPPQIPKKEENTKDQAVVHSPESSELKSQSELSGQEDVPADKTQQETHEEPIKLKHASKQKEIAYRPTASVKPVKKDISSGKDSTSRSIDPLGWIKKTEAEEVPIQQNQDLLRTSYSISGPAPSGEPVLRRDEVILRQETLIIGAIAATFLSIACFFVGHKVGYNKGVSAQEEEWLETIEPKEAKKAGLGETHSTEVTQISAEKKAPQKKEKNVVPPEPVIKDNWTLRVVSYKNTKANVEKAKEVAGILQESSGHGAFVVNTGKQLFVCIGEFESSDSPDLVRTQKDIADFNYEGKKQFKGCYPIRMR